jgi:hypothetical protein
MQLIGQPIKHNKFGRGIVTDWKDTIITVCFDMGEKKFIYPDAFANFLILKNEAIQKQILEILEAREAKKEEERRALQEIQERRSMLNNLKISPQSQAVLSIEPDKINDVFASWTVSTGCYISGYSRGFPRIPERLKPNSMCLLTVRDKEQLEENRRIIGAFMVEEDFLGSYCRDGIIHAHPHYRLQLPHEQQPFFWPYIVKEPQKQRWGKVPFKYMSNHAAERILFNIKSCISDAENQKCADAFYQYFCEMNRIRPRIEEVNTHEPDC